MKLTAREVVLLIVVVLLFWAGASALLTGEVLLRGSGYSGQLIHLEGLGAYIMGVLFIGVAALGAISFRRR